MDRYKGRGKIGLELVSQAHVGLNELVGLVTVVIATIIGFFIGITGTSVNFRSLGKRIGVASGNAVEVDVGTLCYSSKLEF